MHNNDRYFPLISAILFFVLLIIGLFYDQNALFFNILVFIGFFGFLICISSYYFFECKKRSSKKNKSFYGRKNISEIEDWDKFPPDKFPPLPSAFIEEEEEQKFNVCEMEGCQTIEYLFCCPFCGKHFCSDHHLPINHNCVRLYKWKITPVPGVTMVYPENGSVHSNDSRDLNK